MIVRFSLYGFLKNQRYFEPFLVLALLDRGLSFFAIGVLVALRELTVHLLEIPSGAIADLFGRSRAMIVSFAAYIASFVVFAQARSFAGFVPAMLLFAVGEAFRTGTHKAIIFAWLRQQGREDERTKVYGYTRSWSKLGSATSALLGAGFVFYAESYVDVFYFAIVPYLLCMVSLATYPRALDYGERQRLPARGIWANVRTVLASAVREPRLRRLLLEAMGFEGLFKVVKDYLQPVLLLAATAYFAGAVEGLGDEQRTALWSGAVYSALFFAAAYASRKAHVFAHHAGSDAAAAHRLWVGNAGAYAAIVAAAWIGSVALAVAGFVLLHVLQNLWRPILIGRVDAVADSSLGATTLSVESQAQRLATMVLAPLLGWVIDSGPTGVARFWPIGAVGLLIAVCALWRAPRAAPGEP